MRTRSKVSLLALSMALCLAIVATTGATYGQAVYGSVIGTVTDSSGATVPDATVTITNIGTNVSVTTKTNGSGNYTHTRLIPGAYHVKVEAPSFKAAVVDSIVVNVDTASTVNITLQAGQVTEQITVTADAPQLKTDRADVATTFETRQVTDLPILDRNFTKFILLTPGTQQLGWQHAASENPQGSIQTMVNGQHFSGTGYQLDGTENRDPILGIIVVNPNFEAIGETKITSQNYDAEFGQAIAGVVSVSTKSGTNDLHGAAFLFRQNDVLQARNPFSQFQRDPVTQKFIPDTLRNQFGGAIGGPIIKNRLFFFGDFEGLRSKTGGSKLLTVPTVAARGGDLSAYGINIFDPTTSVVDAKGNLIGRTQFDGNKIPTGRLSQQALNLLNLIPLPNAPGQNNGTLFNYVASGIEGFDKNSFDTRIDFRLSDKLNMFGRYSFANFSRIGPTALGEGGGRELVSLGGSSKVRNQSLAYGFDYTWSSTLITDFRFGFFRYKVNVLPFDFGQTTATDVGVPGLNLDEFSSGLFAGIVEVPGTGEIDGFRFGSGLGVNRCNCPLDQDENQFQFVSNTTKFSGNHTFKFGVDVRRAYNLRIPSDIHRAGELTFSNNGTRGPDPKLDADKTNDEAPIGGLGLATFLLGDVSSFGRYNSAVTDARERQWRHFYYGQDTWRVKPKLTLNYGLRLDIINPQSINNSGNAGFLDLDTGEILTAGLGDTSLTGNVNNSVNIAPRVSLAYTATDKVVIRAGYGRSYDIGVFGSLFGHSVTQNLPVLAAQRLNPAGNFDRVFTLAQGPPSLPAFFGLDAPPNQGGQPNTSMPSNGRFFLPDGVQTFALPEKQRLPSVDAYNVTLQFQMTNSIALEAAYVGNKGTHVFAGDGPNFNINQATLDGFGTIERNQRRPFFNKFGWTQDIPFFCNCSDNRYDSLQTKVTKRFSNGYSILAHYTLQRALQDNGEYFIFDQNLNRGPADWDRRHSFVFSQVWELPFGKGKRYFGGVSRAADYMVGGWQFNSNTTIQSGLPFNVEYNAGANIDTGGDTSRRPNINGDPNFELSGNVYTFDLSAFSDPGPGKFGNLRRNAFRGPGYWRTDASLFKKFKFTETKELEFRMESVNLFNNVNRGNPNSFIGDLNSPRESFGSITSTAYGGADPQRNFQFALKFKF
jgi:carboxypeptidase family protein/TonB-dependent receptor-like protein